MGVQITIKTNRAKWEGATNKAADFAAAAVAEQMMQDSRDIIPKEEGALRDSGQIETPEAGRRALVWSNVYAAYQWFGMRADETHKVKQYTTPGTGKMWVETARAEKGQSWKKVAQNGFTEGLKK